MSNELLVEIATLIAIAAVAFLSVEAIYQAMQGNYLRSVSQQRLATWVVCRALELFSYCILILFAVCFLFGCTPRTGLSHQYHVTSIAINGIETRTDFELCKK